MLLLNLRAAVSFDLHTALAVWLDDESEQVSFQPVSPLQWVVPKPDFSSAACRAELLRLQALRTAIVEAFSKPDSHKAALSDNALQDVQEYHAVLLEFEKRGFPTLDDDHSAIQMTWKGAYDTSQRERHSTLTWDRMNIVFNTAALYVSLAADASVTDRNACKEAVGHCQQAANLLTVLKELVPASQTDIATVDLSNSMLTFWIRYLTAEAQVFVYRMASLGGAVEHGTLSGLAESAYLLFNEALTASQDPRLESELGSTAAAWGAYCKSCAMLNASKAEYHQAVLHRLSHAWGLELARLGLSLQKLEQCQQFLKSIETGGGSDNKNELPMAAAAAVVSYTRRECDAILPVVRDRRVDAEKDNKNVYQEDIPRSMPAIAPKQLAKVTGTLPAAMLQPVKPLFTFL